MSQSRLINLNVDALTKFKAEQFPELCKHILGENIPGRKEGDSKRKNKTGSANLALESLLKLATKEESSKGQDYNKELGKAIAEVIRKFSDLKSIINKSDVSHGKFSNDKNATNYKGTWVTVINDFLKTLESNKAVLKQEQIVSTTISISNITPNITEPKTEEKQKEVNVKPEITNSVKNLENSASSKISSSSPLPHQILNSPTADSNSVATGFSLPSSVNNISLKPGAPILPAKQTNRSKLSANEAIFGIKETNLSANEANDGKASLNNNNNNNYNNNRHSDSEHYYTESNFANLSLEDSSAIIGENGLPYPNPNGTSSIYLTLIM